ncbi:class I SAM-dependent methyltransferase [uncultured Nocardioides sp.]|uniref:Methyltransferase type 11 domain-containing protein n=1 Tax=uncultured Nocardioides sp. TaxID=198441 RepID=A0A6J4N4N6_9ACTN|nr:class I SAM-dependent methyltransferase [uncultured Nocardioides sp.]CAA9377924.1 MAG: hypothetical protein AVDCRST_MAG06-716 [uncultured Nocardioides sp.]
MRVDDPDHVREQYADETRLATRTAVWQPSADGRDPVSEALAAVERALPGGTADVLEVGCGTGAMAERIAALPGVRLVAVDFTPRFVELTAGRGIDARQADIQYLPFGDGSFDVVYAGWMLYHVPDLDRGLAEIRRVLRPGGTLVAVTNGDEHLADLREAAGAPRAPLPFSSENGAASLASRFTDVRRQDLETRAVFADHAGAQAYLDTFGEGLEGRLPHFDGSREYAGHVGIFEAR